MNTNLKPWASNYPSPYEGHDLTHRPDWANIIVWDAFFNNLTAGFMVFTTVAWFLGGHVFSNLLPFALTLALIIVLIDLALLVFDLGDPPRFIHAMRVLHFKSPLSVGVWGLACYSSCLGAAVAIYWLTYLFGSGGPVIHIYAGVLMRLFTVLAFIGALVVICYKGVAFSCTSQPGVKDARWLTSFMVSDALLMGCGLYAVMAFALGSWTVWAQLLVPMLILLCARCVAFALMYLETRERAKLVYHSETGLLLVMVYLIGGLGAAALAFFGPSCMAISGVLVLLTGIFERYWRIGLTKKI